MRMRCKQPCRFSKRAVAALFGVATSMLPMAGCQDVKNLKAIVFTRPSEKMPRHQKVAVSFEEQNWTA